MNHYDEVDYNEIAAVQSEMEREQYEEWFAEQKAIEDADLVTVMWR